MVGEVRAGEFWEALAESLFVAKDASPKERVCVAEPAVVTT